MLEIEQSEKDNIITFKLNGTLDADTVSKFNEAIDTISDVEDGVDVDCTKLSGISGAGFEAISRLTKMVRAFRKECRITNVSENVYYLFNITGLTETLRIEKA